MNPTHILSTSLSTAAKGAANTSEPPVDSDAAQAFGVMLGEEIDAAALLGAKDEKIAPSAETALPVEVAHAVEAPVDPAVFGLQLVLPAQAAAAADAPLKTAAADAALSNPGKLIAEAGTSKPKTPELQTTLRTESKTDTQAVLTKPAAKDAIPVIAADVAAAPKTEAKAVVPGNESTQALAAIQSTQAAAARPAEQSASLNLSQPVGSERWNTELGQTVNLLIRGDQTRASLHVTPPELGPIEVKIDLSGDQASISFTVQQADTRAALENALPRLREMLADSGINLGQSQVNHQAAEQRQAQDGTEREQFGSGEALPQEKPVQISIRVGLVDTFA